MHLYGLIIGLSIVIGVDYCSRHNHIIPKFLESKFTIGLLISGFIGARIYHVVDLWDYYSNNLIKIPQTWNGGLGIFGAFIGGIIFIFIFSLFYKLKSLSILDVISPILPLCQAIGRLGNWANQENPVWWIEALPNIFLLLLINKYPKNPTAKYLIGYGVIRFATEYLRQDTWIINNIKIGQILSLILIILGVNLIYRERLKITKIHH